MTQTTHNLETLVPEIAAKLEKLEHDGRNGEADQVRCNIRDMAGYRTPSGTWRIRYVTVARQAELGL
jgi:hypothetical protein